ncbi:MAG: hypothetical protein IJX52_01185 [Oscillibacter sp.]|nr:hypothetical protein [Oscillibacter sp.]
MVDLAVLELWISELRARPLMLLCRTPEGEERSMGVRECRRTGSRYLHVIIPDELDELLERELNGEG